MANDNMDRVVPLDQLDDFKIAKGDPDVRGWSVLGSDGQKIGDVDNLLIDTQAMKVRYLDVDVDNNLLKGERDRHVLIPIGYARLDENDDRVMVDALASNDVSTLPAYTQGTVTRDYETSLRERFDSGFAAAGATAAGSNTDNDRDFYEHDDFDDNRFYGGRRDLTDDEERLTLSEEELQINKQRRAAGEVEINKRVETEHVRESVPVSREEVVIERRPVTGDMSADARIGEDEIHIPLTEEELTVNKRAVAKEELVVKKREVIENEVVEADLRKERAEIHRDDKIERK